MHKLYLLNEEQQAELIKATGGMKMVIAKGGVPQAIGNSKASTRLWKKWAKEMGFKIKSLKHSDKHENGFLAIPKKVRTKK